MIINKVIIKDFFRYYGEQSIEYTNKNSNNVVVIIGENGRGKTTLLSVFNWVLYGEVMKPLTIDTMLNENKAKELKFLEETEAFVSLEFTENNESYILRRSQRFVKSTQGKINKAGNSKVSFIRIKSNGVKEEIKQEDLFINRIIPKSLSGFFFFDGERIDRLAKIDGKKEIKKAILDILGIDTIENAQLDLNRTKRHLVEQIKIYSKGKDSEALSIEHTVYKESLEVERKKLIEIEEKIKKTEMIFEKCNRQLRESNIEEVRRLEEQERGKNNQKSKLISQLVIEEKKVKKHISENYKYHLMVKNSEFVENFLEERREKGQLPSNIKVTFLNDLLHNKKCICGCSLVEGSEGYKNIEMLRENAGRSEFDEAYVKIKGLIDGAKKNEGKDFFRKLNYLNEQRKKVKNEIIDVDNKLNEIRKKLSSIETGDVAAIEEKRDICRKNKEIYLRQAGEIEAKIKIIEQELKKLEIKIKETNSKYDFVQKINKKLDTLNELIELNDEFKELFTKIVREELDLKIKEVFAKITNKDYRVPVLNENFELKITSKLNEDQNKEVALSTGEGQITSLSFIGALVSYARENKDNDVLSSLYANEYPIVMDSPFGNLDQIHTKNVAKNIGYLASQVIIIVSQKQWVGYVEESIKDQVSDKYIMRDGDINSGYLAGEYTEIVKEV